MSRNVEPPTSVRSARVSAVRALSKKSERVTTGQFIAEGIQSVREALTYDPGSIVELYATSTMISQHPILSEAVEIADDVLAAMCDTKSPQGVIAVCHLPNIDIASLQAAQGRVAILSNVRDPGNAGTIIRSADAFDFDAVLFVEDSVDPWSPKVVRSAAGSHWHLPVAYGVSLSDAISWAHSQKCEVIAADLSGEDLLSTPTRAAWLFGNEAWGLSPEALSQADRTFRIPMNGRAESLNLATAAGIVFFLASQAR
ncbi:MAG: RNA methyltransferase [Actinobacteria bacterium]|nr:RNA methyltransferase [Actinomycetota bacterium]